MRSNEQKRYNSMLKSHGCLGQRSECVGSVGTKRKENAPARIGKSWKSRCGAHECGVSCWDFIGAVHHGDIGLWITLELVVVNHFRGRRCLLCQDADANETEHDAAQDARRQLFEAGKGVQVHRSLYSQDGLVERGEDRDGSQSEVVESENGVSEAS